MLTIKEGDPLLLIRKEERDLEAERTIDPQGKNTKEKTQETESIIKSDITNMILMNPKTMIEEGIGKIGKVKESTRRTEEIEEEEDQAILNLLLDLSEKLIHS